MYPNIVPCKQIEVWKLIMQAQEQVGVTGGAQWTKFWTFCSHSSVIKSTIQ